MLAWANPSPVMVVMSICGEKLAIHGGDEPELRRSGLYENEYERSYERFF